MYLSWFIHFFFSFRLFCSASYLFTGTPNQEKVNKTNVTILPALCLETPTFPTLNPSYSPHTSLPLFTKPHVLTPCTDYIKILHLCYIIARFEQAHTMYFRSVQLYLIWTIKRFHFASSPDFDAVAYFIRRFCGYFKCYHIRSREATLMIESHGEYTCRTQSIASVPTILLPLTNTLAGSAQLVLLSVVLVAVPICQLFSVFFFSVWPKGICQETVQPSK